MIQGYSLSAIEWFISSYEIHGSDIILLVLELFIIGPFVLVPRKISRLS
jgi:hypothetical protein